MDIIDLEKERDKIQRKIEILDGITYVTFSSDISLVAEMKMEYNEQLSAIIDEENRIQHKNKHRTKMALAMYKILLFGGGIASLYLFYVIVSHKSANYLDSDIFVSLLCTFYVIFSVINIMVLSERKIKYAIAIIVLVPCTAIIAKKIWGYDVFHIINEVYISFALSLYSFISSLLKDLKKWNKSGRRNCY